MSYNKNIQFFVNHQKTSLDKGAQTCLHLFRVQIATFNEYFVYMWNEQ